MSSINEDIIKGLSRGDSLAMKKLFDLYYMPLCCYAKRYVASMIAAEEIVSDVMYRIWQNRNAAYHACTFSEYLYAATRNAVLNYLKRQQNIRKLADDFALQFRDELINETPLDNLIISELQSRFDSLMASLPEQCRRAYRMSRIDDMTYEEIAAQMNISTNTVKHHIKTALQKLRIGLSDFLM
jgi:RNA polymerase sigma-70 factor (ECF subfamily)